MSDADIVRDLLLEMGNGDTTPEEYDAALAALDRLEAENEHLRRYEDRGDFLVYRSEWETLFSPSTDLRERMEIMRQTLARLEAERDAWKRLADGKEVERLRQEVERLEAERDEWRKSHDAVYESWRKAVAKRDALATRLRDAPLGGGGSHWDGCWRAHIDCALVKIDALNVARASAEAERDRLREALDDACQRAFAAMNQRAQADYGKTWQAYRDYLLAQHGCLLAREALKEAP